MTDFLQKYRHIILYVIFGVLTTLVNITAYWLMAHIIHFGTMPSTVVAWVSAVLFAYVTNRKWVFHSKAEEKTEILKEVITFFVCRIATGIADLACMYLFAVLMGINDVFVKTAANILVIILNYVASKFFVFRSK